MVRWLMGSKTMSELLQFIIVVAFGAFCFGCGYLTAFIVTRNQWRDEMIKRGIARYNWHTGKWEWGVVEILNALPTSFPSTLVRRGTARMLRRAQCQ